MVMRFLKSICARFKRNTSAKRNFGFPNANSPRVRVRIQIGGREFTQ